MGARPVAAFLSLGLPRALTSSETGVTTSISWITRFLDGLLALAAEHKVPLAGGDLAESPIALADIILTGAVPAGRALLRSGARPGDRIYVTGTLGGSAAELAALAKNPEAFAALRTANSSSPHLYPQPRIAQGIYLRKYRLATAAMDLSDGLSTDLAHLCQASSVSAEIHAESIPLFPGATLEMALHGGEDYELLFTTPATAKLPRSIAGIKITPIGQILKLRPNHPQITLQTKKGLQPLKPQGWEHFS
jgi:thiamine-monophosphate kinase